MDKYQSIVWERPVWGWGGFTWPKLPRLDSIDNEFLLLALEYGVPAAGLFALFLLAAVVRLVGSALRSDMRWNQHSLSFAAAVAPEDFPERIFA